MSLPPIVEFVHDRLTALGNVDDARDMAAYMKTTQPFYGVPVPKRDPVFKELCAVHAPRDGSAYRSGVLVLWGAGLHGNSGEGPGWPEPAKHEKDPTTPRKDSTMKPPVYEGPRELMYAACYYAEEFPEHLTTAHLPLFKRLVMEGGWWDIVDQVADKMVGHIVRTQRGAAAPIMRKWLDDDDLWVRRSAIICQLSHKEETDEKMLFDFCLKRADEEDFFIRKAIGWSLRQYGKTNPDAVKKFLKTNAKKLSALTVREAGKNLDVKA